MAFTACDANFYQHKTSEMPPDLLRANVLNFIEYTLCTVYTPPLSKHNAKYCNITIYCNVSKSNAQYGFGPFCYIRIIELMLSACGSSVCIKHEMESDIHLCSLFQIGFAAVDAVTGLKLIEGGIPRETIAFLALAAVPIQVILPAVLRYSVHKPC